MSDDAENIRRQMQNVRQELGSDVKDIVHGARQLADWRYHVRSHPWACVAGAFALGFLVTPARKAMASARDVNLDQLISHLKNQGVDVTGGRTGPFTPSSLLGRVATAAAPLVARTVMNVVAQRLAEGGQRTSEPSPSPTDAP